MRRSSITRHLGFHILLLMGLRAEPVKVAVSIDESRPGPAIPPDFLGFSYEKNVLALDHFRPSNTAMLNLMRHLGDGVLRLGANYVEVTRWEPEAAKSFSNQGSVIGLRELQELYGFSRACGWKVIHGLNLGINDPDMAAREAAAAVKIAGDRIVAFEIGNEPEHYGKTWRAANYNYQDFSKEISTYLKAMQTAVPRLPLAGPATTSNFPWFSGFIRDFRSNLVMTTRHNYPLAAASQDTTDPRFATIENLLSPATAAASRKLMGQHQQASQAAGLPFRVGEAGSASSGGKPGVSDVFASGLWCADYLFDLAALGVAGVNFHGSFNCRGYTSFCASKNGGYHAHANYYGMLFFRQAAEGRVVPVAIRADGVNLTSHAILSPDGTLRVALINKDVKTAARVTLTLPGRVGRADLIRLTAPSPTSKTDIKLSGAVVNSDGTWSPHSPESVTSGQAGYVVDLTAASAALLSIRPGKPLSRNESPPTFQSLE